MIRTKEDLRHYLKEDARQFEDRRPTLRDWILRNERWYIYLYKRELRYAEYYKNTGMGGGKRLLFLWHFLLYKRLSFKLRYHIALNATGPGLSIFHIGGYTHVPSRCRIGRNCTITEGTVFGKRRGGDEPVSVGDGCYFGIGVKVLGSVTIGNNVSVGAYSVVTHDIPDNAIVAGNPARVLRYKTE